MHAMGKLRCQPPPEMRVRETEGSNQFLHLADALCYLRCQPPPEMREREGSNQLLHLAGNALCHQDRTYQLCVALLEVVKLQDATQLTIASSPRTSCLQSFFFVVDSNNIL